MTSLLFPKSWPVALAPTQGSSEFACEQVRSPFKFEIHCFNEADELITILALQMFVLVVLHSLLLGCTHSFGIIMSANAQPLLILIKGTIIMHILHICAHFKTKQNF